MGEDEAFIRAIVDGHGDDTPRLVYADWLDDRSDPRGPYLRAGMEWAKPWKNGTPPGWSDRVSGHAVPEWAEPGWRGLEQMLVEGRGFDPVWVARVSRPPVGACCDHLRFAASGPQLTNEAIAAAEARYGKRFPIGLTAFLLNYNGGQPNRHQLVLCRGNTVEGLYYDWVAVDRFAVLSRTGVGRSCETLDSLRDELEYAETELDGFGVDNLTASYVPIGRYDSTQFLLMKFRDDAPEAVYGLFFEDPAAIPEPLVPSLPQLLARIITGGI